VNESACITITAVLVPYLRAGIRQEISLILESLAIQVEATIDENTFRETLELFEIVGIADQPPTHDLQLELDRWAPLTQRALTHQHAEEVRRLKSYADDGCRLSPGAMPELASFVDEIRTRLARKT
jgi:hypothetical protein